MNKQHKINEALYFLKHLNESHESPQEFSYNLSAFLSAARSILQYIREEAKNQTGGQAWYDTAVSSVREVKFLRDKRNISIHECPVLPDRQFNITLSDDIVFEDSIDITVTCADGVIKGSPPPQSDLSSIIPNSGEVESSVKYFFPDWPGTEDVIEICNTYIKEIEKIVTNGRALDHIA